MGSSEKVFRIGSCAPGTRMSPDLARRAQALTQKAYGGKVELVFHPQCFRQAGHFAGEDHERIDALVELANDPKLDAVWFARGGYGACRVAEFAIPHLDAHARAKRWMGYSDAGFLLYQVRITFAGQHQQALGIQPRGWRHRHEAAGRQ